MSLTASSLTGPTEEATQTSYTFPAEEEQHEGAWLTWPHQHTYGKAYAQSVEDIWVEMAKALAPGERVHIIAYDQVEQERIGQLLEDEGVDLAQVDFVLSPSDDVWARDTGPMFVFDEKNQLHIVDFDFDG